MTDGNELANRARAGDPAAFETLLETQYERIYALAYRYFGEQADAEDIAEDVCLALPNKLRSLSGRARISTWIYPIVMNACRDQQRKQKNRSALDNAYGQVSEPKRAADRDTEAPIEWIYGTLDSLNTDLRETAILVLTDNLTHPLAGEIFGVKA